jgi:hypothetical protein
MHAEPLSRALSYSKTLTWDGTGAIVVYKKLDAGKFELPKATRVGDQHVIVSLGDLFAEQKQKLDRAVAQANDQSGKGIPPEASETEDQAVGEGPSAECPIGSNLGSR